MATVYHDRSWGAKDTAEDGAFSSVNRRWDQTRSGTWYIEQQRAGDQIIATGLAYHDRVLVDRGLRILEWGFAQQNADGSFPCEDPFHSTSFFVEAATHSVLLLEAAPEGREFDARVELLRQKLARTAQWMTQPGVEQAAKAHNAVFTHRRFLIGAALGEAGVVLRDQRLVTKSAEYICDGFLLQMPDEVNREKHGYDSNYQAVGLVFAMRYYRLVASDELKQEMYPHLAAGIRWQRSRITPAGDVLAEGNTRTAGQERNRDGTAKSVNYSWTVLALADWATISGDRSFDELASRVWKQWEWVKTRKA
ncbi:MAG TPA: hypothetical protein VKX25_04605 [Bryobacteraceae bacterium]|nr:hypothetical protein [Bryobacteraceae bacterium]